MRAPGSFRCLPLLLGLCGLTSLVDATEAPGPRDVMLELLREQRPDVRRWEIHDGAQTASDVTPQARVVGIGRVAARMPLRFADGRVRWFVVAGFRPVSVTRQAIAAGEGINPNAIDVAERDVIALGCEPVSLETSDRWRARRRLSTGDALCVHSVEAAPDVERDQAVTLSVARGGISASRPLTAMGDAREGERVRLRDRSTGDIVIAIVTGRGAARIPEVR